MAFLGEAVHEGHELVVDAVLALRPQAADQPPLRTGAQEVETMGTAGRPYAEELVDIVTDDGVPLGGAVVSPGGAGAPSDGADGVLVLWVHGAGVRFYLRSVLDVCRALARRGLHCLTVNTRGHDYVTRLNAGGRRTLAGTGYEQLDDCPHDLRGWLDFAQSRGFDRVGAYAFLGYSRDRCKSRQ
jgi:hypothetical protein